MNLLTRLDGCGSCKYFEESPLEDKKGDCRRYPPKIIDGYSDAHYPEVHMTSWCGEYKSDG